MKFESFESKIKFMDTALFLFGMKLHRQERSIEFFDADFSNTLSVRSQIFDDRPLGECMKILNEVLISSGFSGGGLLVGKL